MPYVCDYCEYIFPKQRNNCPFCGCQAHSVDTAVDQLRSQGYTDAPSSGALQGNEPVSDDILTTDNSQSSYYQQLQSTFSAQNIGTDQSEQTAHSTSSSQVSSTGYRVHVTKAQPLEFPREERPTSNGDNFFSQFNSPPPRVEMPQFDDIGDDFNHTPVITSERSSEEPVRIHTHRPPRDHTPRPLNWRLWLRVIVIIFAVILVLLIIFNLDSILSSIWSLIVSLIPIILLVALIVWLIRSLFR